MDMQGSKNPALPGAAMEHSLSILEFPLLGYNPENFSG
jgi:hypothetical protein